MASDNYVDSSARWLHVSSANRTNAWDQQTATIWTHPSWPQQATTTWPPPHSLTDEDLDRIAERVAARLALGIDELVRREVERALTQKQGG